MSLLQVPPRLKKLEAKLILRETSEAVALGARLVAQTSTSRAHEEAPERHQTLVFCNALASSSEFREIVSI